MDELVSVRKCVVCFRMIEIKLDSGGQELTKFRSLGESQFRNLDIAMIFMNKASEVTKKPSQ
jgi:hypothetical protein